MNDEYKNLGDGELSPTEKPSTSPLMNHGSPCKNGIEEEGAVRVLRNRVASQDQFIKKLEADVDRITHRSVTRGILLGRALTYIQPGRDALPRESKLRVEVSGLINDTLAELDQEPEVFTGRLNDEQAKKFVELATSRTVLSEDIRRICLTCGAEIPEEEMSCPKCYSRDDASHALAVGKDVHERLMELWDRAHKVGPLEAEVVRLKKEIEKIESHHNILLKDREEGNAVAEVHVAGRMLGKLNGMVNNLDSLIKDAEVVIEELSREREHTRQERLDVEKAVAEHIERKLNEALRAYIPKLREE